MQAVDQHYEVIVKGGISSKDDHIFNCCTHLKNERKRCVIVSEDNGVRMRSFSFSFECYDSNDLERHLNNPPQINIVAVQSS